MMDEQNGYDGHGLKAWHATTSIRVTIHGHIHTYSGTGIGVDIRHL